MFTALRVVASIKLSSIYASFVLQFISDLWIFEILKYESEPESDVFVKTHYFFEKRWNTD